MAAAVTSDRAEVDTARPFRSVREAVAVFGDRILVGQSRSRSDASSVTVATSNADVNANAGASATPAGMHEASSSSSTITHSPNPMAESDEAEAMPAVVPMYSAPSSPPSLASSPSPNSTRIESRDDAAGQVILRSIVGKLETEVAETRREVARLGKRSMEMELAVASLNAQLHRGLSKLAEMEADKAAAARRSIGGDSDVASIVVRSGERYWGGDKLAGSEYLPSFSHALSLGELDDYDDDDFIAIGGRGRRRGRKAQKVKPIVPLIGDILFSKRKSTKEKGDGLYSGDLYSTLGN